MTFTLATTTLGTAHLNSTGQATFSTSGLPVGTDTITVAYSGDANFAPASTTVTIQVAASSTTSTTTGGTTSTGLSALAATGTEGALSFLAGLLLLLMGAGLLVISLRRRTARR